MIAFPAGVTVWIAGGVTDMRCGMNTLSLKIHKDLGAIPMVERSSAFGVAKAI